MWPKSFFTAVITTKACLNGGVNVSHGASPEIRTLISWGKNPVCCRYTNKALFNRDHDAGVVAL